MTLQETKHIHRKSYLIPLSLGLFFIAPKVLPELRTMLDAQITFLPLMVHWILTKLLLLLGAGTLVSPILFVIGWRRNRRWKRENDAKMTQRSRSALQSP